MTKVQLLQGSFHSEEASRASWRPMVRTLSFQGMG